MTVRARGLGAIAEVELPPLCSRCGCELNKPRGPGAKCRDCHFADVPVSRKVLARLRAEERAHPELIEQGWGVDAA